MTNLIDGDELREYCMLLVTDAQMAEDQYRVAAGLRDPYIIRIARSRSRKEAYRSIADRITSMITRANSWQCISCGKWFSNSLVVNNIDDICADCQEP